MATSKDVQTYTWESNGSQDKKFSTYCKRALKDNRVRLCIVFFLIILIVVVVVAATSGYIGTEHGEYNVTDGNSTSDYVNGAVFQHARQRSGTGVDQTGRTKNKWPSG